MADQDVKWRGYVSEIISAPVHKVWEILSDFGGLHKHFPQVFQKCEIIEGEGNHIGTLRSLEAPLPDGTVICAIERLVAVDEVKHTTSYTMEQVNVGWTGYQAYIVADSYENDQTRVTWSFEVNPIAGQRKEEHIPRQNGLFETILKILKEKMDK